MNEVFICPAYVVLTTVKWQFFNNLCLPGQSRVSVCVPGIGPATADGSCCPLVRPSTTALLKGSLLVFFYIFCWVRRLWNFREFMSTWEQAPTPGAVLSSSASSFWRLCWPNINFNLNNNSAWSRSWQHFNARRGYSFHFCNALYWFGEWGVLAR